MRTPIFIAAVLLAGAPLAGGCVASEPLTGQLELPLVQPGPHGEIYHLANATFDIAGGSGFAQTVTGGDETSIVLSVPPGPTTIELHDGWTLERSVDGGHNFAPVQALLGSPNPMFARILANQPAIIEIAFLVRDPNGTLEIRLGVTPTPRELAGPVFVNTGTDGLAGYANARLDFAIFFDLAQLDSVTLGDGTRQHVYTAGPTAMEFYNDRIGTLAGLDRDFTGGILQYTVAARPDGTIELSGSLEGATTILSFGPHAIDFPPGIGGDGFPLDEFFLDFASPFTLSGPDGTLSGFMRPRHLVP